jgi:hypothetical protein
MGAPKVDKERARDMRRDGLPLATIAEVFGVTPQRIQQICRGIEPEKQPRISHKKKPAVGPDWTPEGEQINGWEEEGGKRQSPFLANRCKCERPIPDGSGYCTKCGKVRLLRIEVL